MPQPLYLPEVRCELSTGLRDSDVTVCIADEKNRRQFLHVEAGMVNEEDGIHYLPVGIVEIDYALGRVLIELPLEADSGANRMWMPFDSFRQKQGKAEAVA